VFRTAQAVPSSFGEDATRFFSASQSVSPIPPVAQSPFDLTALRWSLPAPPATSLGTHTPSPLPPDQAPTSSWATEFLTHTSKPPIAESPQPATPQQRPGHSAREQLFQPSFSYSASYHTISVNVVRMLFSQLFSLRYLRARCRICPVLYITLKQRHPIFILALK